MSESAISREPNRQNLELPSSVLGGDITAWDGISGDAGLVPEVLRGEGHDVFRVLPYDRLSATERTQQCQRKVTIITRGQYIWRDIPGAQRSAHLGVVFEQLREVRVDLNLLRTENAVGLLKRNCDRRGETDFEAQPGRRKAPLGEVAMKVERII